MMGAMTPEFSQEAIGIRKLSSELITQAIRDLASKNKKIRQGAEDFMSSDEFAMLCYDLNICPQKIRKQATMLCRAKLKEKLEAEKLSKTGKPADLPSSEYKIAVNS